jgi:hypothetical protein
MQVLSVFAARLAWQSSRLLAGEDASVGSLDRTRINEQFATRPAPPHDPQPWIGLQVVPSRIKHPLHNLHAPEYLNQELLGQNKRSNTVHDNRFETRLLIQHTPRMRRQPDSSAPNLERASPFERRLSSARGKPGNIRLSASVQISQLSIQQEARFSHRPFELQTVAAERSRARHRPGGLLQYNV